MLTFLYLLTILTICTLNVSHVSAICIEDHCERSAYCYLNTTAANPKDCSMFYVCDHGGWEPSPCAPGTFFDIVGCICNTTAQCAWCNTTEPEVTIPPGVCDNVPDPCEERQKYPDISDCEYYYECTNSSLERKMCGQGVDTCYDIGVPCVFDIHTSSCRPPDGSFNCDYRCLTTAAYVTTDITSPTEGHTTIRQESTAISTAEEITTIDVSITEDTTRMGVSNTPDKTSKEVLSTMDTSSMVVPSKEAITTTCANTQDDTTAHVITTEGEQKDDSDWVVYLGSSLLVLFILLLCIAILCGCRRWHRKPLSSDQVSDKRSISTLDEDQYLTISNPYHTGTPSNLWRSDPGLANVDFNKWLPHSISQSGYDTTRARESLAFIMNPTYQELLLQATNEYELDDIGLSSEKDAESQVYDVIGKKHTAYTNPVYGNMDRSPGHDMNSK